MSVSTVRRVLLAVVVGLVVLTGCAHGGSAAAHASDKAKAQAVASSTQGQAAKKDATQAVQRCQPKGTSTSSWEVALATPGPSGHAAREAFYTCEHMTPAQKQAAGTCTVNAVKDAAALPPGTSKADRETKFFTGLNACVPA